jgi:50S ribosomal protein L16 3-hydroxylase
LDRYAIWDYAPNTTIDTVRQWKIMHLHNFDIDAFLRDVWQQKPLLIKNPWTKWQNPLEPDELAGLACEEDVESRLIEQLGGGDTAQLKAANGSFTVERLSALALDRWTLLVQAVDHYVHDVAALIEPFRFIPNWRIDDVMVSLAADGGGVGPHFDQYDVFLIQGLGRRRWQVGARCDENTELLPHDNLRLLAEFEPTGEWVLEPGDILYVPPGIAHNGVAIGDDCITYSIGFRAPSAAELIGNYTDDLLDTLTDDDRYGDKGLPRQSNPGEIRSDALDAMHAMITQRLGDRAAFERWFGKYSSTPKYPDIDWAPETPMAAPELRSRLLNGEALSRNPASRFAFIRHAEGGVTLFADGDSFTCEDAAAAMAQDLCAADKMIVNPAQLQSDDALAILAALYNKGSVAFADDE